MNAKDTVIGTTKRLVAEILGDGGLAEEGARQSNGTGPRSMTHAGEVTASRDALAAATALDVPAPTEDDRFALLLGHAALNVWADLPRDAQEELFSAAVDDGIIANSLAVYLHARHPKTYHPPKPEEIV